MFSPEREAGPRVSTLVECRCVLMNVPSHLWVCWRERTHSEGFRINITNIKKFPLIFGYLCNGLSCNRSVHDSQTQLLCQRMYSEGSLFLL